MRGKCPWRSVPDCGLRLSLKRSICMYIGLKLLGCHCGTRLATLYTRSAPVFCSRVIKVVVAPHSAAHKHGFFTFFAEDILSHTSQCESYVRYYHVARLYSHTGRCATPLLSSGVVAVLDQCVLQSVFCACVGATSVEMCCPQLPSEFIYACIALQFTGPFG